jgi:hypothetical protein
MMKKLFSKEKEINPKNQLYQFNQEMSSFYFPENIKEEELLF